MVPEPSGSRDRKTVPATRPKPMSSHACWNSGRSRWPERSGSYEMKMSRRASMPCLTAAFCSVHKKYSEMEISPVAQPAQ